MPVLPVNTVNSCSCIISTTRFDFGVPLEDVFPPNGIHSRLQYLFGKAYESHVIHGYKIDEILRYGEGSVEECLKVKEILVHKVDYHLNVTDFSPGTYFWVIRHFLGLLPLPILPSYTNEIQFDWKNLSLECKDILRGDYVKKNKYILDYDIAHSMNMLPNENFILLNFLLSFVQKLCIRTIRGRSVFDRKSILNVSKYFCSSMFVRPYRPGFYKHDLHLPLLLYLILRWQKICQQCDFNFRNIECCERHQLKDNCTQTNILSNESPNLETLCRDLNISKFFLKETGCQTDSSDYKLGTILECNDEDDLIDSNSEKVKDDNEQSDNNAYKLAYIDEGLMDTPRNQTVGYQDNSLYQTALDISFQSIVDKENHQDWRNIVQETENKIKKIEESYIYDDYETFAQEDFNQIGKPRSKSFINKITKQGYASSKAGYSLKDAERTSTPNKISPEGYTSYVKYPDVCDDFIKNFQENNDNHYQNDDLHELNTAKNENTNNKKSIAQKLFEDNSPGIISESSSKQDLQSARCSKIKKRLKIIRMSFEFLRLLTPKKSTFKRIESRVKYHRMRQGKANSI